MIRTAALISQLGSKTCCSDGLCGMITGRFGHRYIDHVTGTPAADVIKVAAAAGVDERSSACVDLFHAAIRMHVTENVESGFDSFRHQVHERARSQVLARRAPEGSGFKTTKIDYIIEERPVAYSIRRRVRYKNITRALCRQRRLPHLAQLLAAPVETRAPRAVPCPIVTKIQ